VEGLQQVAIAGKWGKQPGSIRPFDRLTSTQLKKELRARKIYDFGPTKKDVKERLNEHLRGIQRVPSLLLHNPTQHIGTLNLQNYTILECEPLHDIKGHLTNIFEALPSILERELAKSCKELLDVDLLQKDTKRGADCRLTAIHLLSLLKQSPAQKNVVRLIETIVSIAELLYSDDTKRSPQAVLKLYNSTFLHHELCKILFEGTTQISHRKLFGSHLHALVVHAPTQYEIMCLRSCNAEFEERLFGQAKAIALATTNRQPNTIIPNVLLRLQAKQRKGGMYDCMLAPSSKISKESQGSEDYITKSTFIETSFIEQRMASWQGHLQRISHFLLAGEGVWWRKRESGYEFMDGSKVVNLAKSPKLLHYRDTGLLDIQQRSDISWNKLIAQKILLPTPFVRLYDSNGKYCGRYIYNNHVEFQHNTSVCQEQGAQSVCTSPPEQPQSTPELPSTSQPLPEPQSTIQLLHEMPSTPQPLPELSSTIQPSLETTQHSPEKPSTSQKANYQEEEDMHQETSTELQSENEMEVEEVQSFETKLARAVNNALGSACDCQSDLKKLDNLRATLKQGHKTTKEINKHKKLMSIFRIKLHQREQHLKALIMNYEQKHYSSQQSLPDKHTDTEYNTLLRQHRYTSKLIASPDFTSIL
jgi:hypothetical protein